MKNISYEKVIWLIGQAVKARYVGPVVMMEADVFYPSLALKHDSFSVTTSLSKSVGSS